MATALSNICREAMSKKVLRNLVWEALSSYILSHHGYSFYLLPLASDMCHTPRRKTNGERGKEIEEMRKEGERGNWNVKFLDLANLKQGSCQSHVRTTF